MNHLLVLPFILGGILIIVFHRRLAAALQASNRSFYSSLFGQERTEKLRGTPDSRRYRAGRVYVQVFLIFFGLAWIAISVYDLVAH